MHKNALFLLKNCKNRSALGDPPPDLLPLPPDTEPSVAGGFASHTLDGLRRLVVPLPEPRQPPQLRNPGYATARYTREGIKQVTVE